MSQENQQKPPFEQVEEWLIDEPAFGYHPLQAFNAIYELSGKTFPVVIQGFVKENEPAFDNFRYRVRYADGEEKVLQYEHGTGFTEEGKPQSAEARLLGECIQKHFSEEPNELYDEKN